MFDVVAFDEKGARHELSNVKIALAGQTETVSTASTIKSPFIQLPRTYFSAGQDASYYADLFSKFSEEFRGAYLTALRDVVFDPAALEIARDERVFNISILRSISVNAIENQFRRVLAGGTVLTDYDFRFELDPLEKRAGFILDFRVKAHSLPPTNIHAIIGRNGVGKTSLLNSMIRAVTSKAHPDARFGQMNFISYVPIGTDYFSSLISISFSAFDPFTSPEEQPDPSKGTCYFYVGLKDFADEDGAILKSLNDLYQEFIESLEICLSQVGKRTRWLTAISTLETDDNFAGMGLANLSELEGDQVHTASIRILKKMSSGHAIVLLTITKLVARLEEKTLVLFDEPESHLHPPLLSALVRSLSELLIDRNAVAIIATHSPVVLQEIPRSCVWKIGRVGLASSWARPDIETFGENVGSLTREVFGLEVSKSGFNALLAEEADSAIAYEDALARFDGQLGFEGRAILRSLLHHKGDR
jgi:predicted ATPase